MWVCLWPHTGRNLTPLCCVKGCLLTDSEESVSINGRTVTTLPEEEPANSSSDSNSTTDQKFAEENGELSQPPTTLYRSMRVNVVDGETGDKFTIENVPIKLVPKVQEVTNTVHYWMEINHPTIQFSTSEILIGNRSVGRVELLGFSHFPVDISEQMSRSNVTWTHAHF